jgi:hypothetical protein
MRDWAHLKTARTIIPYLRDPARHHDLMVFGSDGGEFQLVLQDREVGAVQVHATKESWASRVESEGWEQAFDAAAADVAGLPALLSRSGVTYFDPSNRRTHVGPAGADELNYVQIPVSGDPLSPLDAERRYVDDWPPPRVVAGFDVARRMPEVWKLSDELRSMLKTYSHTVLAGAPPDLAARTDITGERRAKLELAVALWADMLVWREELRADWRSIVLRNRVETARLEEERRTWLESAIRKRRGLLRGLRIVAEGTPIRQLPQTEDEWAAVRAEVAELSQWRDAAEPNFETQKRNAVATLEAQIQKWAPPQR